jgi:hypothetical protein
LAGAFRMSDLGFVVLTLAAFAVMALYVHGCEKLR